MVTSKNFILYKVKLDLLTDISMLLMVEKDTRGKICHALNEYGKANNKHLKHYDKNTL